MMVVELDHKVFKEHKVVKGSPGSGSQGSSRCIKVVKVLKVLKVSRCRRFWWWNRSSRCSRSSRCYRTSGCTRCSRWTINICSSFRWYHLWSGAANAIPTGWVLCNGSNRTPDLRGRFVVGIIIVIVIMMLVTLVVQSSVTLETTAQLPSHTHGAGSYGTSNPGNHTHTYIDQVNDGNGGYRWWKGGDNDCRGDNKQTEGSGGHNHRRYW